MKVLVLLEEGDTAIGPSGASADALWLRLKEATFVLEQQTETVQLPNNMPGVRICEQRARLYGEVLQCDYLRDLFPVSQT
jgi:hypothetical protein